MRTPSRGKLDGRLAQAGQAMVEWALVLPVLLLMVFGVIEFTSMLQAVETIQHAADEGARYATTGDLWSGASGAAGDGARERAVVAATRAQTTGVWIDPATTPSQPGYLLISVRSSRSSSGDPAALDAGWPDDFVVVDVVYNYKFKTSFIDLLANHLRLTASSTSLNERFARVENASSTLPPVPPKLSLP